MVQASIGLHVGLMLVLILARNFGWETRARFDRLERAAGAVVETSDWSELRTKSGKRIPLYETRVAFTDHTGAQHELEAHWAVKHSPGERVTVEYGRDRPSLARIQGERDEMGWLAGILFYSIVGMGYPLFLGSLFCLVYMFWCAIRGTGKWPRVTLVGFAQYTAASIAALAVEAGLIWYLYWL